MTDEQQEDRSASRDEEYHTLLEEIRVLLPAVEVLFAFLLTVPFTGRFREVSTLQRATYFAAFLSTASALVTLITPSVYHRLRWREAHKEEVLRRAHVLALIGTALFAVAVTAVVYTVTDVLYGVVASAAISSVVALTACALWFGLAYRDRERGRAR